MRSVKMQTQECLRSLRPTSEALSLSGTGLEKIEFEHGAAEKSGPAKWETPFNHFSSQIWPPTAEMRCTLTRPQRGAFRVCMSHAQTPGRSWSFGRETGVAGPVSFLINNRCKSSREFHKDGHRIIGSVARNVLSTVQIGFGPTVFQLIHVKSPFLETLFLQPSRPACIHGNDGPFEVGKCF